MDDRDLRPSTELTLIDKVCDRFEAAWKAGNQPRVEDYLDGVSQSDRAVLKRALRPSRDAALRPIGLFSSAPR